jgi:pimeloyl-ACP methyl ester carboxylesterase
MSKRPLPSGLLLLAALALPADAAVPGRLAGKLAACELPGVPAGGLCGTFEVAEDRGATNGRTIALRVVVLPATGPDVAPDPLVFLAGGGVAPATSYAAFLAHDYALLRRNRDVLLVDQRGTGASNPLACDIDTASASPSYRDPARFTAAVRRCRDEVSRHAELRYYTTPQAMADLEEVRGWLSYPRLNLYGVSYGSQAAMEYVRLHPDRARAMVLHGVLPLDESVWLDVPRNGQDGVDRMLAACASHPACHGAFPRLAAELPELLHRLAEKPATVDANPAPGAGKTTVRIDEEVVRDFISRSLYGADRIHDLPLLLHLAHAGDYDVLAQRLAVKADTSIPRGIYYTLVCSEETHFDPAALPGEAAGKVLGVLRVSRDLLACRDWPRGELPASYFTPLHSSVPALVMNGALDHVTPPRYGERVMRTLTNARRLVLPLRGHNDTDACVASIVTAFVEAGEAQKVDASCLDQTPPLSFATKPAELTRNED